MDEHAMTLPTTDHLAEAVKKDRYVNRFRSTVRSTFLSLVVVAAVAVLVAVLFLPILRVRVQSHHCFHKGAFADLSPLPAPVLGEPVRAVRRFHRFP